LTYEETRDEETLRLLKPAITAFIRDCKRRRRGPRASAGEPQTLFFFPAGMASHLTRATRRFDDDGHSQQTFDYSPVWVTPLTPFGGARDLAIHRHGRDRFRDKGDRIIIADKALDFDGCTPHDGLIKWARNNHVRLFVFPWDWRRRLDETVTFFVNKFLPHFRKRVIDGGCKDPLARFSLVGHSFGGMIVNLILRGNAPIVKPMAHAITVATPFYGYAGQLHRWFEGEDYLNLFGLLEQDIIEMISTLPAVYTLHFLDEQTFEANQSALGSGEFPLRSYPSMDKQMKGVRADPYNPETYKNRVRYPGHTGFDMVELERAKEQFQTLASALDPDLLKKFHNIRGVTTAGKKNKPVNNTIGSVTWDWISSGFDANDPSPIKDDVKLLPGDNTQPAWTTCLVTNGDRCLTVRRPTIDHGFMMNDTGVLESIQGILFPDGDAVDPTKIAEPEAALDQEVVDFLVWLSENLLTLRDVKEFEELMSRDDVPQKFQRRLPNIARRFISDVMKRPGPEGLRPGNGGRRRPRAPGRRSVGSRKRKRS
jgi:hypothetical protein